MDLVAYEEYLNALRTVERYQRQFLAKHNLIQDDHKAIEDIHRNSSGTMLLLDFFDQHSVPKKYKLASRWPLDTRLPIEEWTVEFFLDKLLDEVDAYPGLGCVRGISAKALTELLITFSENGFEEDISYFETVFWKSRVK